MTSVSLTSELEALNGILTAAGYAIVDTLDDQGLLEVSKAKQVLSDASRQVQAESWWFNRETNVILAKQSDGTISIPYNVIQVISTTPYSGLVLRGAKLYDSINKTYVFQNNVTADLLMFLSWEELPQSAREYIKFTAARKFQTQELGNDHKDASLTEDTLRSRAILMQDELTNTNENMLYGSLSVFNSHHRNNRIKV